MTPSALPTPSYDQQVRKWRQRGQVTHRGHTAGGSLISKPRAICPQPYTLTPAPHNTDMWGEAAPDENIKIPISSSNEDHYHMTQQVHSWVCLYGQYPRELKRRIKANVHEYSSQHCSQQPKGGSNPHAYNCRRNGTCSIHTMEWYSAMKRKEALTRCNTDELWKHYSK